MRRPVLGPDGTIWGKKNNWNASKGENLRFTAVELDKKYSCGGQAFHIVQKPCDVWFGIKRPYGHYCLVVREVKTPQCTLVAIGPKVHQASLILEVIEFGESITKSLSGTAWDTMCDFSAAEGATIVGRKFGEPWGKSGEWKATQYENGYWVGLAAGDHKRGANRAQRIGGRRFRATLVDQGVYFDPGGVFCLLVKPLSKCAILAVGRVSRQQELNHEMLQLVKNLKSKGH